MVEVEMDKMVSLEFCLFFIDQLQTFLSMGNKVMTSATSSLKHS